MTKYLVSGWLEVDFEVTVDAESKEEAIALVQKMQPTELDDNLLTAAIDVEWAETEKERDMQRMRRGPGDAA